MKRLLLLPCILILLFVSATFGKSLAADYTVLFLGDSLTAGLGVASEESYPSRVSKMLADNGLQGIIIINGGISGSTTASIKSRMRWYDRSGIHANLLFLAMGANDGLRGLPVEEMEQNLEEAVVVAKEKGMEVILAGMEVPPNYGQIYAASFRQVFSSIADRHQLSYIPFLLQGVGGVRQLNQADGIHPNARGHEQVASHVYPFIEKVVVRASKEKDE